MSGLQKYKDRIETLLKEKALLQNEKANVEMELAKVKQDNLELNLKLLYLLIRQI